VRKLLVTLAASLTLAVLAVPASAAPSGDDGFEEEGVLTVGTNLPAPGFWTGDDPDDISGGFEYGMALELAERLGRDDGVKVVNVSFDALVAGNARGFDIALSQVTITKDRRKVVDFSTSYFSSDQGILVQEGMQVPDVEAAKALQWGVQSATTAQAFLEDELKPDDEPQVYQETTQAFAALQAGQIDAVLLDTTIVLAQSNQPDSTFEVVGQFKTGEKYGAVLPKDSELLKKVNKQLKAMKADGTLDALAEEFLVPEFGKDPADVPYIEV
jgi:polar amino acid transport system substrate-binding protein